MHRTQTAPWLRIPLVLAIVIVSVVPTVAAGQGRGVQPAAPANARAAAALDLTGYWVSVVTQDWRWRMVTPAKGDYGSIPINLEAKKIGDAWDPAKDEGEPCKPYGAPALMNVPTRLRISWQDDNTLKIETDAGTQTRMFRFGDSTASAAPASWQGNSIAEWESPRAARGSRPAGGSLKVVTKNLRSGYLRKNGVPYSANAVLTEYWDLTTERNGDRWITLTSTVDDSTYLREPWVTALQFRKEPDGGKWDPTPCSAR